MNSCHLCKSYIIDFLDAPIYYDKKWSIYSQKLRPILPELCKVVHLILQDLGDDLKFLSILSLAEIIDICITDTVSTIIIIENALEDIISKQGLPTKVFRGWILEKIAYIIKTISIVHLEHSRPELSELPAVPLICDSNGGLRIRKPPPEDGYDIFGRVMLI
jgi:hypothetical protein